MLSWPVFGTVSWELFGTLHPIALTARRGVTSVAVDVSETRVFGTISRAAVQWARDVNGQSRLSSSSLSKRPDTVGELVGGAAGASRPAIFPSQGGAACPRSGQAADEGNSPTVSVP